MILVQEWSVECVLGEGTRIVLHAMELELKYARLVVEEAETSVCIVMEEAKLSVPSVKAKVNPNKNVPNVMGQQKYSNRLLWDN